MNKSNEMTQALLKEMLGAANVFSDKGLHYLACRFNGKTHHNLLEFLFNKIHYKEPIIDLIDTELQTEITKTFGLEKLTDAALVILATGRRPVFSKLGWSEGGYSLLKINDLPKNYDELDTKGKTKADETRHTQLLQRVLHERVVELIGRHVVERTVEVVEPPPVIKTNNVKPFPKKTAAKKPAKETVK